MMALDRGRFGLVAKQANLAPSVHNTQPVRWRLEGPRRIGLFLDAARLLPIGDPELRDAGVSAGAAVEATYLVLSGLGLAGDFEPASATLRRNGEEFIPLGTLSVRPSDRADPLLAAHFRRTTWRGGFAQASAKALQALRHLCDGRDDVTFAPGPDSLLAELGDKASLGFLRQPAYREELRSWMRLSPNEPGWELDGLDARSLALSRAEAKCAGILLDPRVFALVRATRLDRILLSERAKTLTASAILLAHRPEGESPIESGRALLRLWLEITRLGLAAWPMASVADDRDICISVSRHYGIPDDRRLITALRVGAVPLGKQVSRVRLPPSEIVLEAAC